jgi:RNA polymerase sigma factor (sigma-70 family)
MDEHDRLAELFEENRAHLQAVAFRILGSLSEAEDAVQEGWLRLSRSDSSVIENLGGWLTTVVARVSLNMLQTRTSRREDPQGVYEIGAHADGTHPEDEAMLADSVGRALLVILDTLAPAERLAFVLHDMFAVPFDEIAPIVGRSPAAARQLASRARRRVQGAGGVPGADHSRHREIVAAFLAASRSGQFDALVALLDPDVELRGDPAVVAAGASAKVVGAPAVAATFSGCARGAQPALVDGTAGAVWAQGGQPRVVFDFTIRHGKIVGIEMIADPVRLGELDLVFVDERAARPAVDQ